jgi:predicted dehydrogenase
MTAPPSEVRIGCLGAARIAPAALIRPAQVTQGSTVSAVAARDRSRGQAFAAKHGIPQVYDSYEALVSAPDVDAVYIPLPNGLHGRWTEAALESGKHVLCEKPFTANAEEARAVAEKAATTDRVVMEAFHWRYHPLAHRLLEIIRSGELGKVRHFASALCFPLPRWGDIRWQLDLAGGSLMDAGCYPVHIVRTLAGSEPEVVEARAKLRSPGIDRWITARLRFADGATGAVTAAMWSGAFIRTSAKVVGERGTLSVFNPQAPQIFHLLSVRSAGRTRRERVRGGPTYEYQLRAFVDAVAGQPTVLTPPADSVANMEVIDSIYRAAGLEPRPVTIRR